MRLPLEQAQLTQDVQVREQRRLHRVVIVLADLMRFQNLRGAKSLTASLVIERT